MSESDLAINCWMLGEEYDQTFQVKLSVNEDVAALRLAVKSRRQITLKNFDAESLILYGVSIPCTPELAEQVAALELNELRLHPLHKLSAIFVNGLLDTHVHVAVGIRSRAWLHVVLS
jgi:hypothetical protein